MATVSLADLPKHVGQEIGVSNWTELSQDRINVFAENTEDPQFIHVDPERAARETPFGGTIAHGFLTLSMLSAMAMELGFALEGMSMGINYGFDKVRFLQPVRAGGRIRGRFTLDQAEERHPGQWMLRYGVKVEIEGEEKPALIAQWLTLQIVT
jgi:acyl dehydratase